MAHRGRLCTPAPTYRSFLQPRHRAGAGGALSRCRRRHEVHGCLRFPGPRGDVMWSGPRWILSTHCVCHNRGPPSLAAPNFIKELQAHLPNFCPQRRHCLYHPGHQNNFPSVLSSTAAGQHPGKDSLEQKLSPDIQKRPRELSQRIWEAEVHALQVTRYPPHGCAHAAVIFCRVSLRLRNCPVQQPDATLRSRAFGC